MKKLRKTKFDYSLRTDVRKDELRFGRYLYLLILTIVIAVVIHVLFGNWYLMKGSGFVFSEYVVVESEFKATVINIFVENGQWVKKKQPLFAYNSEELKSLKQGYEDKIMQTNLAIKSNEENIKLIDKDIQSFRNYFKFTQDFKKTLKIKQEQGIVQFFQMSLEFKREFDARKTILDLEREKLSLKLQNDNHQLVLKELQERLELLLNIYQDGNVLSPVDGVVAEMKIVPGTVLEVGERSMNIFYGKRYILGYLNPNTWVDYNIGDNVLVSVPQRHGLISGKIDKLLPVTAKLPEEFQPRFSSKMRHQIYLVDTKDDDLIDIPILTTVSIYRTLMHDFFTSLRKKVIGVFNWGKSHA